MATIGAYKGVDITGGTDAEVAAQMKNIDTQAITPQSFVPTAPAKATPQPIATAAEGLSETLAATADTYNQDLQKAAETKGKDAQSSLQSLVQNMLGADGQTSLTAQEYADTGVNTAEADVKDINSQIISEQRALDKQIRALKENKQGLFGGALEQEIDRVRGESLTRQADLAIIQMARQGKYDSAKAIADRAVAAKLERQAQITEALKLSYQENKELFTKAEQRAFESAQKDRERKLEMQAYQERARFEQKIRESDPLYQAQLRKAQAETGLDPVAAKAEVQKNEALALAKALRQGDAVGKKEAIGASPAKFFDAFGMLSSRGLQPDRVAFEQKVDTLKSNLTLDNLKLLKGAMSDKDLLFLNSIGSSLNVNMSEAEFDKELDRVITKLEGAQTSATTASGAAFNIAAAKAAGYSDAEIQAYLSTH